MKRFTLLTLATAALLASCSQETDPVVDSTQEVGTLGVKVAGFGIEIEEKAFSTKAIGNGTEWSDWVAGQFAMYTAYMYDENSQTLATTPNEESTSQVLTGWGEGAELTWNLYAGTYDVAVSNYANIENQTAATTALPTKELAGVQYHSTIVQATVSPRVYNEIAINQWEMNNVVISVKAKGQDDADYFANLESYSITVSNGTDTTDDLLLAGNGVDDDILTTDLEQGFFDKDAAAYKLTLKYKESGTGNEEQTLTADVPVLANKGEEAVISFKAYKQGIEATITAPDGTTTIVGDIDFAGE